MSETRQWGLTSAGYMYEVSENPLVLRTQLPEMQATSESACATLYGASSRATRPGQRN